MSADNSYVVASVEEDGVEPKLYGVFYAQGDVRIAFPKYGASALYTSPLAAIVGGHMVDKIEKTEYGVWVHTSVLDEVEVRGYEKGHRVRFLGQNT